MTLEERVAQLESLVAELRAFNASLLHKLREIALRLDDLERDA